MPVNENDGLDYKPITAWGYVGWELLFAIPLVGLILLIVFACGGTKKVALKSFARSYFCGLLIAIVLVIVLVVICFATGVDIATVLANYSRALPY